MNGSTDLDRVLAEWLDEGPTRAPEHPIQMAIEHARVHPRRPDPIWFIRADAMSPRAQSFAFQPAFALLAVGLLLAAVVAIGVGSQNTDQNVPPPTSSVEPSTPPTAGPPTPSPSPTPPTIKNTDQISFEADGFPVRIDVYDLAGSYVDIEVDPDRTVEIPDGQSIGVENVPGDETSLRVAWGGCPDQDEYLLTVDTVAQTLVIETAPCAGDTLGVGRNVILHFDEAVPAGELEVVYRENVSDN